MDEKYEKIIELLKKDARMSYTDIAKKMRVTEATIRKRVKQLEEDKVILKYTIELDPRKVGYNTIASIGVDTTPESYFDVIERLKALEEVKALSTSSGDHMILANIWARDGHDLMEILGKKIGTIKGITKICPAVLLEKVK